jgi:hypothetical protein
MPQKAGTTVAIINVGDDVHYYSTSYEEWMPAKVVALNEDNSFELDIKSGAHPSLVIKNPTPEDLASKPKCLLVPAYTPPPPREINEDELPPAAKVVLTDLRLRSCPAGNSWTRQCQVSRNKFRN